MERLQVSLQLLSITGRIKKTFLKWVAERKSFRSHGLCGMHHIMFSVVQLQARGKKIQGP